MMTTEQYRAALKRLGLSQLSAAELFRVNPRTSRRWALGESEIPPKIASRLRLMLEKNITPADVERLR